MAGKHRADLPVGNVPPSAPTYATPQDAYQAKVSRNFAGRMRGLLVWAVVGLVLSPVVGVAAAFVLPGTVLPGHYDAVGNDTFSASVFWSFTLLSPVILVLLGFLWACWMWLLEAHPKAATIVASYGAGKNLAEGNMVRAAASGYDAYYFAKLAAERDGAEWSGLTGHNNNDLTTDLVRLPNMSQAEADRVIDGYMQVKRSDGWVVRPPLEIIRASLAGDWGVPYNQVSWRAAVYHYDNWYRYVDTTPVGRLVDPADPGTYERPIGYDGDHPVARQSWSPSPALVAGAVGVAAGVDADLRARKRERREARAAHERQQQAEFRSAAQWQTMSWTQQKALMDRGISYSDYLRDAR